MRMMKMNVIVRTRMAVTISTFLIHACDHCVALEKRVFNEYD